MANQQLVDYVRQQLAAGASSESIRAALAAQNWQERDIAEAFIQASGQSAPVAPVLPGPGALLADAWKLFTNRLLALAGIAAIPVVVMYLGMYAFGIAEETTPYPASVWIPFAVGLAVFILFGSVLAAWSGVALIYALQSEAPIGIAEAYRLAWPKILSFIWVKFLSGFIVAGAFLLFVVPGIILGTGFVFGTFILINENERGMRALLKSREYVRGYWWAVLGRLLFVALIALVTAAVLSFFLQLAPQNDIVSAIPGIIINIVIMPFMLAYSYTLYARLKAVRGSIPFAPTGKQKGLFTGIGIVGIVLIPLVMFFLVSLSLNTLRGQAEETRQSSDLRRLQIQLELYKNETGSYPEALSELIPVYFGVLPSAASGESYVYTREGAEYRLCAPSAVVKSVTDCVSSTGE